MFYVLGIKNDISSEFGTFLLRVLFDIVPTNHQKLKLLIKIECIQTREMYVYITTSQNKARNKETIKELIKK